MSRFRILQIVTRLNIGGPALQIGLLASRLDPALFETLVITGREDPGEGNMVALGRVDHEMAQMVVPSLGRAISPVMDLRALARITAIARWYRPDLVHTHLSKAGFVGRVAARAAGARVIVHTYHGSVWHGYFGGHETGLYLGIERALARMSTRLIAISQRQRAELIRLHVAPPNKIAVIPVGFTLEGFLQPIDIAAAKALLGVDPAALCIALVARLVPIKDVPTFLRSVAIVAETFPEVEALIVGDGTERASLERLAHSLGISERCRFTGWLADLRGVYAAADIVALSSINEGAGASLVEAMAAGRPVVATSVGGVPEIVSNETGILVPPQDPTAFAAAIVELLGDAALRKAMGTAARESALAKFSAARLVSDIDNMYRKLLGDQVALDATR